MSEKKVVKINESPSATPADLLRMAVSQDADIDKLEKLMGLQERWEANEARKYYVTAMSSFRNDCPMIDKTKKAHNSKYAGLAETIEQIKGLMSENGLSHSWRTETADNVITVTCIVTHVSGHSEQTSLPAMPDTSGSKNSIQAIGSTVSYLQRYTLFSILGLASAEMDDDGAATSKPIEYITDDQALTLESMITDNELDNDKILRWMDSQNIAKTLAMIPASKYNRVLAAIQKKIGCK